MHAALLWASVAAHASSTGAPGPDSRAVTSPATAAAAANEAALLTTGAASNTYRRVMRNEARAEVEADAAAFWGSSAAIDAPRRTDSAHVRSAVPAGRMQASDSVVLPHQAYALMSAGLLGMALVVVRRRRH